MSAPPSIASRRHLGFGFWAITLAYLAVVALSTAPAPLYPLYQRQDGFSTFIITLVYAALAVGVITSLILVSHLSDRHGRRRVLVPAVTLSVVSALVFMLWPTPPGLFLARFLGGVSIGAVTATATVWLAELHAARRPLAPGGAPSSWRRW